MSSGIYIYISNVIPLHQLTRYGTVYGYIWERCGEVTELEGREPIINTPPHLSWHPKGTHEKERWERVRGCDRLPSHEEPHKLRGSMKKCAKPPSTVTSAISKVHLYQPPHRRWLFRSNSQSPPSATTSPGGLLQPQKPRSRHRCLAHTCTQRPYDHWLTKRIIRTNTAQRWHIHKHPTSSGKKQSSTTKNAIAAKHRSPGFCLPPTAIQTKPVVNDKEQQTRELVEMVFSITAQISEMDISEYNTKKRVEMDFSMTTQEPVERV